MSLEKEEEQMRGVVEVVEVVEVAKSSEMVTNEREGGEG